MEHTETILVVGAGIAGLTLTAALQRAGFDVDLIEHRRAWPTKGPGLAIQPNGTRVLRTLGLGEALESCAASIERWRTCSADGALLCEADLPQLWGNAGPFLGVTRQELHACLLAHVDTARARLGVTVKSLQREPQAVEVQFSDGARARYALVVGADGLRSRVRELLSVTVRPSYSGQMVWRSVAPSRPRGVTGLVFLLGAGSFFGLCPVGNGRTYGFGNVTTDAFEDPVPGRLERLRERFAGYADLVQEYLAALECDEQVQVAAIESLDDVTWGDQRVVLVGDAAHASLPMLGQGASMALEDTLVLTQCLCSHTSTELAIAKFVERRTSRVRWVMEQSRVTTTSLAESPARRDRWLLEHGAELHRARYTPLLAEP